MQKRKNIFILFLVAFLIAPLINDYIHLNNHSSLDQESIGNIQLSAKVKADENNEDDDDADIPDEFSPDTSHLHPQWNHNIMNIGEAWADGYTGKGVKIAILDTGFYHRHPDISIDEGYSVFSDDPWSNDHSGHGTHIAGIISARRETPYQGIAPDADIYGIKIYHSDDMDEDGEVSTDTDSVRKGVEKAMDVDADIILISSGLNFHDEELYQTIKEAYDQDILIIAASGNGTPTVNYPASYEEVVAVTAIDEKLDPALDIIYGQENEFSAPGVNIGGLSIPDSKYSYPYIFMSGSSQAAPHAAGLAAILIEKYNIHGQDLRKKMEKYSLNIGDSGLFGHGLLYYISDTEKQDKDDLEPIDLEELEDIAPSVSEEDSIDENEVRKPPSSREADVEIDEDDLIEYHQIEVADSDIEGSGIIEGGELPLVESGGTLEILLQNFQRFYLTEKQIAQIRENNIRLILKKDHVSWTIPPANFAPGEAVLRFYEGPPTGVPKNEKAGPGAYTISLYQETSRSGSYPSPMNIEFDFNDIEYEDTSSLKAYYWNPEKAEWRWTASERDEDEKIFSLETKNTTAVGFFDSKLIQQAKQEDPVIKQPKKEIGFFSSVSGKWLFNIIIVVSVLFTLILLTTKKE